ncbi:MAG TPA: hypothetical protein VFZ61_33350 [Polyangiales bacterium]
MCSGLFGCALQIAGAYQAPLREQHPARSVSLELALRYKPAKGSGGYAAFDSSFSDPTPRAPFSLREAAVGGGYHVMFPRFALEVGPRLGLGRPATSDFPGTSLHTAVDVALLYRAWNDADRRLGFQSFAPSLDVVLFARGGVWSRPISHPGDEVLDAALGLGVRVNLASGITDLRDRDWELP